MFEQYYKLNANPFRLSADESFRFAHKNYLKAWSHLRYALDQSEGFVMITGSPGSGKTTLIRDILSELDESKVFAINLVTNQLQAEELLRKVALEYGLPAESYNKATLLMRIEGFVEKRYQAGQRAIIVIDEAQNLTLNGLEELRLLSNLQSGSHPLFQIFLVGQDELRSVILGPEMEHIRQRMIASCQIEPMNMEQTEGYIEHRLGIVGWNGDPKFNTSVFPLIHFLTDGIPRKVNHVVGRLLLYGALEEKHEFTDDDVWIVARELFDEERLTLKEGETFDSFKSGYLDDKKSLQSQDGQSSVSTDGVPMRGSHTMVDTESFVSSDYTVLKKDIANSSMEEIVLDPDTGILESIAQEQNAPSVILDFEEEHTAPLFDEEPDSHLVEEEESDLQDFFAHDDRTRPYPKSRVVNKQQEKIDEAAAHDNEDERSRETIRQTESILNLPSMRAERHRHEIESHGGLINTSETEEPDEHNSGGNRFFRVIGTILVIGCLVVGWYFVAPVRFVSFWGNITAWVEDIGASKDKDDMSSPGGGGRVYNGKIADKHQENGPGKGLGDSGSNIDETLPQDDPPPGAPGGTLSSQDDPGAPGGTLSSQDDPDAPGGTLSTQDDPDATGGTASLQDDPDVPEGGDSQQDEQDSRYATGQETDEADTPAEPDQGNYEARLSRYQQTERVTPGFTEGSTLDPDIYQGERKFLVFFGSSSNQIPKKFHGMLNNLVTVMSINKKATLKVRGYTDPSENPLDSMRDSLARAQKVSQYFVDQDVNQDRILIEGHAASSDVNDEQSLESRLSKRRVEVILDGGGE
jgi:type II secretory pathway predicted ATPase ExeA/outer membrane protein OmpA-like peptidoglycan-associated protein